MSNGFRIFTRRVFIPLLLLGMVLSHHASTQVVCQVTKSLEVNDVS